MSYQEVWTRKESAKLRALRIDPVKMSRSRLRALVAHFKENSSSKAVYERGDPAFATRPLANKIRDLTSDRKLDWLLETRDRASQPHSGQRAEIGGERLRGLLDEIWIPSFLEIPINFGRHSTGFYCEDINGRRFCWEQQDLWPSHSGGSEQFEGHDWNLKILRCWFDKDEDQWLRERIQSRQELLGAYADLQQDACMLFKEAAEYKRDIELGRGRVDWREIKAQLSRGEYPDPTDEAIGNIPYLITEEPRLAGKIESFSRRVRSFLSLE